jgi:hypothetical protein
MAGASRTAQKAIRTDGFSGPADVFVWEQAMHDDSFVPHDEFDTAWWHVG